MAGVKISALTGAATLDGTEQIPVVQSGSTVRTTVAGISGQKTRVTVTASTYTVQPEDDIVEINTGTCAVTLPALSTQQKPIKIIKISSSAGTVTINRAGSDVISTASLASIYMQYNGEFYVLAPLSSRWDATEKRATRTVTGNATIALEDCLFINTGTATITTPANLPGEWEVQKISATAGTVTINAPAGATYTRAALSSVTLTSNGDRWRFKPITSTRIDLVDGYESGAGNTKWIKTPDGSGNISIKATCTYSATTILRNTTNFDFTVADIKSITTSFDVSSASITGPNVWEVIEQIESYTTSQVRPAVRNGGGTAFVNPSSADVFVNIECRWYA